MTDPKPAPTVVMTDIVFPEDTNSSGTMFGGRVMALMDKCAFLAGVRFAHVPFVTISSDGIRFHTPILQGDIIETRGRVAFVGRTSLIVKVEVFRSRPLDTGPPVLCTNGWFAMAARDRDGSALALPPLLAETEEEKRDHAIAREFRERSLRW